MSASCRQPAAQLGPAFDVHRHLIRRAKVGEALNDEGAGEFLTASRPKWRLPDRLAAGGAGIGLRGSRLRALRASRAACGLFEKPFYRRHPETAAGVRSG